MSVPWSIFEAEQGSDGFCHCSVGPFCANLWESEPWVGNRHMFLRADLMGGARPRDAITLHPDPAALIERVTSAPRAAPEPTANTPFRVAFLGPLTRAGLTVSAYALPNRGHLIYRGDDPVGLIMPKAADDSWTVRTVTPELIAAYERVAALGLPDALAWTTAALALGGDA